MDESTRSLRKDSEVYLIGTITSQIVGAKLPSKKDVLRVLYFNLRKPKLTLRESARLDIDEVNVFWNKARIPVREHHKSVTKLEKLYNELREIQKRKDRSSESEVKKREFFCDDLDNLFDIAHANALTMVNIETDRKFLILQSKKCRPGSMYGFDQKLALREKRSNERREKNADRVKKTASIDAEIGDQCVLESSSSSQDATSADERGSNEPDPLGTLAVSRAQKRGTKNVATPKVSAVLDKCKISTRDAVHLLNAVAEAFVPDVSSLSINRSTIMRSRKILRKNWAKKLKDNFVDSDLIAPTVHWDGKLFIEGNASKKVNRIAIIISTGDKEQILGIPAIESGTGQQQATSIYGELLEWGIDKMVKTLCCDTTASNLARVNGAAVILEQLLERDIMYLPCRHHILEIVLRGVFDVKFPPSTGPDVVIFKRFKEKWPKINHAKFNPGVTNRKILKIFEVDRQKILDFVEMTLRTRQPRDDYEEFLLLTKIFLTDSTTETKTTFRPPGAFHHARWMAKAIYCLKIFMFKSQFKLEKNEERGIMDVCIFVIKVYVRHWFSAPSAIDAPCNDLNLMKELIEYKKIDAVVSQTALHKMENHLWYLTPESAALSFFSENVSADTKSIMVDSLSKKDVSEHVKRYVCNNITDIKQMDISHFITSASSALFERFNISVQFLQTDPNTWSENEEFRKSFHVLKRLRVVNDTAERGIKLFEDYSNKLTKNEEERQYIIRIVSDYRKHYPNVRKSALGRSLD